MRIHKKDFLEKLLTGCSHLKISLWPPLLAYKPRGHMLKAIHLRDIMKKVQPGDILVRTFNNYVDGFFIPGTFTHVGFYMGPVTENHLKQVAKVDNPSQFHTGEQMVIHTLGDKILLDHLIDFCHCDGLAIMRFPRQLKSIEKRAIPERLMAYFKDPSKPPVVVQEEEEEEEGKKAKKAKKPKKEEPIKEPVQLDEMTKTLVKHEYTIAQTIAQGKPVEFEKIFKVLYQIALREFTSPYHYDFEIDNFSGTASTEWVYFITKSIIWNYGVTPDSKKVFFKSRRIILPDDFVNGDLEEIWKEVY